MDKRELARLAMMDAVEKALSRIDELSGWYLHGDEFFVNLRLDCIKHGAQWSENHPIHQYGCRRI